MIRNRRYRLNESAVSETLNQHKYYNILENAFDNADLGCGKGIESYVDYDTMIIYDSDYEDVSLFYACSLGLYKFDDSNYFGHNPRKGDSIIAVRGGGIDVGMGVWSEDGKLISQPNFDYDFDYKDLPSNIYFMGHFTGIKVPFINVTGMSDRELEKALTEFIEGLFNKKVIKDLHRIADEIEEEELVELNTR